MAWLHSHWLWRNWGHTIQVWAGAADCGWGRWLSLGLRLFHEGTLPALGGLWPWDAMAPEVLPGSSLPTLLLQQLDGTADDLQEDNHNILSSLAPFSVPWIYSCIPKCLVVILFWKSGQYGPCQPCLLQFRNALPGLVCSVSPPFNSPLVCFTNRLQLLTAAINLGSQLWDLIHPLQTHAFWGGRHYCSCWRAMSHMLTKCPLIPHRKLAP